MRYLGLAAHGVAFDYPVNLSRPELSLLLRAPLAKEAGGLGLRPRSKDDATPFFKSKDGPDYQRLLAAMQRGKMALDRIKRFDMPGWRPSPAYVREMKRYGALPTDFDSANDPINVYETDERYWRSFWYSPPAPGAGGALSDSAGRDEAMNDECPSETALRETRT